MDPSNTSGMNSTHLQQQPYSGNSSYNFLSDIEAYASANDGVSGNEPYNFPWDPALFAEGESSGSFPQQQQQTQQPSMAVNLNQTLSRPSNSPALQHQQQARNQQPSPPPPQQQQQPQQQRHQVQQPQQEIQSQPQHHHSAQPSYGQDNYSHSLYGHRNLGQPSFDERFMSRPSASPTPFDHTQGYQQMPYNYGYQQAYQRQNSTPTSFYSQRPIQPQIQQSPSMMNVNSRPSPQLSQSQQSDNMHFHQYQPNQHMTHAFVNPSMINPGHHMVLNGGQQSTQGMQHQQQYQSSPYFQKAGSTVDPQILHAMQMQNYSPMPTPVPQSMQQQTAGSQAFQIQNQVDPSQMSQLMSAKVAPLPKSKDSAGPKKPKAKTNKAKKDGVSESDSSDGLEIEEEPPEEKPTLLIVSPPTDEKGKAMYHAVEAVWYPRNRTPKAEDIRKGIASFGETVRSLRDTWKARNETLKKAELPSSEKTDQVPRLKDDVAHYRKAMESVVLRSIQYGHEAIVKRLGENQFTLSALYSFLLDRANVGDYESSLVNNIFKLAVKFETLDEEMLEQVKWSKILHRWTKKASNESKEYAKQILANAAATTARKRIAGVDSGPGSPASINGTKRDGAAGVKRLREGDSAAALVPKKIVKPASKPLALQSAERRKALEKESLQKGVAGKSEKGMTSASSTVASRPKVAMTAPSKANAFAGLLSASKKPGTSNAEKAKAAAVAKEKANDLSASTASASSAMVTVKDEVKKDSPPRGLGPNAPKSATSFMGFLKDMDKPKEVEHKKVESDPNETEEQRAKRLRKEERRKLRVTWKPDNDLVQTKLFTHDPEEETGQTDNMMRDAGDTMKEGEMLKRHIGVDDVDEDDEEEDTLGDTDEYTSPSEVDLSVIDADRAANFVKFGGPNKPESVASEVQTKYEENTLMTTYTLKTDRPDTPKELPSINDDDDDDDNFQPIVDFGEPSTQVRRREKELLTRKTPDVHAAAAPPPPSTDLAAQLRALGMQQPQQQQQTQSTTFNPAMFAQQPSQPVSTSTSTTNPDLSKILAVMQQYSQMQQSQPQNPPTQSQATPASFQAAGSSINPNLAAIVAQVSGQQSLGLPLGSANNPNPFPGNADAGRKHGRAEESSGTDQSNKKKKKVADGKPYNYKTVTCQFWLEGKCTKGENCTYKHEV